MPIVESRVRENLPMSAQPWSSPLEANLRETAVRVALDVAGRLRLPDRIKAAADEAERQGDAAARPPWVPHSLTAGHAGLALLHRHLDLCFPGDGWGDAAQSALEEAIEAAEAADSIELGLGSGLCGLALAAQLLAPPDGSYEGLLQSLDELVAQGQVARIAALRGARSGFAPNVFDAIAGLSGVARYWLRRRGCLGTERPLRDAIGALVALARPDAGKPRWHTPPALMVPGPMAKLFPGGYVDCGLAHGVPGPLSVLALARLQGVDVDGLAEAIGHLASWLGSSRCDDAWGINWPYGIPLGAGGSAPVQPGSHGPSSEPARAGWCYGSPGVARSLYLAGQALGQPELCAIGVQAIDSALARPPQARRLSSMNLCHGHAGLLHIALRFQQQVPRETRRRAIRELTASILQHHAPDSLLGYHDAAPDGGEVDEPALLTGAAGIALALLAAACDVEPVWDCALLIS
jgi:hypothetical protein